MKNTMEKMPKFNGKKKHKSYMVAFSVQVFFFQKNRLQIEANILTNYFF